MFNPEESLPGPLLADFSEIISKRIGLNFPEERWTDLTRSIRVAARDLGFSDAKSCMEWLLSASLKRKEIETLASHLTVGETYFFRDEKLFEALEVYVLRPLIETRREKDRFLSLWSAGCASGEEAYSLAILVKKMIPDPENWRIVIQATDINPQVLEKARKGIYGEWSFRSTPPGFRGQYFNKISEGHWEVFPEIRRMVHFSHHNLAEDPYPPPVDKAKAIDIIVCRNVLMYFTQEKGKDVIQGFHHCLGSEGWLVVSSFETSITHLSKFKAVPFPDAVLYQKSIQGSGLRDRGTGFSPAEHGGSISNRKVAPRGKGLAKTHPRPLTPEPRSQVPDPHVEPDLARHYADMGMLAEAMDHCQRAIAKDQLNPALHYLLASILQEQGQIKEAIKSLKRVLYLDQDFILAHFALGNLLAIQGRPKDSEKYLGNALHLLGQIKKEDPLAGSEGMTAGGLVDIIHSVRRKNHHGPGNLERDPFGRRD